jgi:predicted alpha/beta hydrolase family esterase
MKKNRIFIVHGWQDSPEGSWFPWLKAELLKQDFDPRVLEMPTPIWPQIDTWVKTLAGSVHQPDEQTFLIGHSVGCQTILRYLQGLPEGKTIGGIVLVAGWLTLKPAAVEDEEDKAIADPWLHRPLHWTKITPHVPKAIVIASDNDPYVPMEDQHVFRRQLKAQVIVERDRGHLGGSDGVTQLPSVLRAIQKLLTP